MPPRPRADEHPGGRKTRKAPGAWQATLPQGSLCVRSAAVRDAFSAIPLIPSRRTNSAQTSSGRTPAATQSTIR